MADPRGIFPALAVALALLAPTAGVTAHPDGSHAPGSPLQVGAEFSGQWYNPQQSGHGLLLEVLPDDQAFGAWFVFDDAGNPFWLVGLGHVEGHTMSLDVQSVTGGRFPPHFDPGAVHFGDWGTLTIDFEGCSSATLSWESVDAAFGSGSMALQRLTSIDRLPCGETAKWQADLDSMVKSVTDGHPDPFHMLPKESFEARVAALRQRMASIPVEQMPVAFAELLASLGDAHTAIFLHGAAMTRFPMELSRVREGLIVTAAGDGYQDLLGHRLAAIDGVPVSTIETSLRRIISHENEPWLEALCVEYMVIPEILAYLGHIGSMDQAMFRFQSLDGDIVHRSIEAMPPDAPVSMHSVFNQPGYAAPMHMRHRDNYWYEYMEDSRSMYLAYNRAREIHGMPFQDMLHRMEMFIQRHPVDRLILDLRLNQGGDSRILQPLIDGLLNSPFNHPDRLFVLLGRNTFSSGLLNALQLRDATRATFVCRPTGGKPDHFGETRSFQLEHTGLRVTHSTRYIEPVGDPSVLSLEPDIAVDDPPWRDFLHGQDPCIAAAGGM